MTERARNTSDAGCVAKVLRSNLASLGEGYKNPDLDKVCEFYEGFMVDLIGVTPRPTTQVVKMAVALAFDGTAPAEAHMFAQRITAAVSHCRTKLRSSTSGKKLSASVRAVAAAISKAACEPETRRDC